jgi:hypothetical protein
MAKVSQKQIIQALTETGGVVTEAAKMLGLASVPSLRIRMAKNKALQDALTEIREQTKDLAEGNIISAIKSGDKETSKWYLASQGRDRGYGNKVEVEGKIAIQPAPPDLSKLSMEQLKQLEEIAKAVTGNPATD